MKVPLGVLLPLFLPLAFALTSSCPAILQYKTTRSSALEYQSWSAVLQLQQTYSAYGVEVDVLLDRTVTHFSAHQCDVVTSDWRKFHLSSRNQTNLTTHRIHMTVEFTGENVPQVDEVRLNGVRICPLTSSTTTRRVAVTTESYLRPHSTEGQGNSREFNGRRTPSTTERVTYTTSHSRRAEAEPSDRRSPGPLGDPRAIPTPGSSASNAPRQDDDDWNFNSRSTSSSRRVSQTTTSTSSPYFAGDLHMIFQSSGNDRVNNYSELITRRGSRKINWCLF